MMRGRHKGSVKHKDLDGKPISVYEWRRITPEGRRSKKNYFIKSKYNITLNQYDEILTKQNGLCAICKTPFNTKQKAHIDHDHKTKKFRGLLCLQCNHLLGNAKDNILILNSAIEYLKNRKGYI